MSKPERIIHQTHFTRDKRISLISLILLLLTGIVLSLGLILGQIIYKPQASFFNATQNEQVIFEGPLSEAYLTTANLLNWSIEAIMSGLSFNYTNYPKLIEANKIYFTEAGFKSYRHMVEETANAPAGKVVLTRAVLKPEPQDAPSIQSEGPVDVVIEGVPGNRYAWVIKAPILLLFYGYKQVDRLAATVTLRVVRVPSLQSQIGVKIENFALDIAPTVAPPTRGLGSPL